MMREHHTLGFCRAAGREDDGRRVVGTGHRMPGQHTKRRKPCYVLDAIDPRLKDVIVGRCGFYAKVLKTGRLRAGESIVVERPGATGGGTG